MRQAVRAMAAVGLVLLATSLAPASSVGASAIVQGVGIPLYVDPSGADLALWTQARTAAPTVKIVIANPASGPGTAKDAAYAGAIAVMRKAGVKVIGYVDTAYGARAQATVKAEVDRWYKWYAPDGIFFDEAANTSGKLSYYQALHDYVARKPGTHLVALNPGTNTLESYLRAADVLMIFEDASAAYASWTPAAWTAKYPATRFWQLVYGTPQASLASVVSLSKARNAGYLYVTSDTLPNPWDTLPDPGYWSAELAAVAVP
jgi:hypothetical protein